MIKFNSFKKKLVAVGLAAAMGMAALSGCSSCVDTKTTLTEDKASSTVAVKVVDEDVTLDTAYIYAILCLYTYANSDGLNADLEGYKSEILTQIQTDYVGYQVALKTEGIEWTDEDDEAIAKQVEQYYEAFPESLFKQFGISKEALSDLLKVRTYATKLEQYTKNDLSNEYLKEFEEQYKDSTFFSGYYAFFPITEMDENNNAKQDESGAFVMLSESEIEAAKKNAEECAKRAQAGEKLEDLAKEYGVETWSDTQNGISGMYQKNINDAIEKLDNGDVTDVLDTETGYMVFRMDDNNNEEYKDYFIDYYAGSKAEDNFSTMQGYWMSASGVKDDDVVEEVWDTLDLISVKNALIKAEKISK